MNIENLKPSDIIPYVNNPRHNESAVDAVASSIRDFGFNVPLVLDKDHVIITGHTRHQAALKLGLETVPCIIADHLTPAQAKAFRLADNRVSELATWDEELLQAELQQLSEMGIDMGDFGFTEEELESLDDIAEDTPPEVDEDAEPITQPGDLYELGDHRLLCGDSTKAEDVNRLTDGQDVDLLVTDPPYNVAYEGMNGMTIENDSMSSSDFYAFLRDAFAAGNTRLRKGAAIYIWYATAEHFNFHSAVEAVGWKCRQQLIWVKNAIVLGRSDYQWQHEPCIYASKPGATRYFTEARNESTVIEDRPDIKGMSKADLQALCRELLNRQPIPTTVLREDKPVRSEIHPTMKPVKLFARLVINSSKRGDRVLDLFGGSGTTMMACEQLGRKAYLMELDPKYCDAIVARWEQQTGRKAKRITARG